MGNPEVIYNGISSEDLGLIVTRLPDFHRAPRRYTRTDIPGRSAPVVQDEGGYDTYQTQLEINANGVPLREIYAWLRGEGWMISSDEPDYRAYVYLYGQIEDTRFRVEDACYDTLLVPLMVEPYLREVDEEPVTTDEPMTFPGRGSDNAAPKLTLTGSGDIDLMVNGASVLIDGLDGTIVIDAETGMAYTLDGGEMAWAGESVTLVNGWPYLLPEGNTNTINWSGSVSGVVIQPNWNYL